MFCSVALFVFLFITGSTLLFTVNPYNFIENIFIKINPLVWASIGIASCCGLSIAGAAFGMYINGSTLMGAALRKPDMKTRHLITILFCEAVAIYGIVFSIILSVSFNGNLLAKQETNNSLENYHAGYGIFWSGVTVGIVNLVGGICVGTIGSTATVIDAQNPALFVRLIVLEVLASAIGLFGLISGFIQVSNVTQLL